MIRLSIVLISWLYLIFSCPSRSCWLVQWCSLASTWTQDCSSMCYSVTPLIWCFPPSAVCFVITAQISYPSWARVALRHFFFSLGKVWHFLCFSWHTGTFCNRTSCHHCKDTSWVSFAFMWHRTMVGLVLSVFFLTLLCWWPLMRFGVLLWEGSDRKIGILLYCLIRGFWVQLSKTITSWCSHGPGKFEGIVCLQFSWCNPCWWMSKRC